MVLISRGWKPIISSKKGQFTSKIFKKVDGPVTPRRLSRKQSENRQQCQLFRFPLFQKLNHVILQSFYWRKSRFDIINLASCSTIKQQPLLNWNYYRFNLLTSHNLNIIKEFSGRLIILGWVQAFLVLDGWNRFVVKVFKAIFC